MKFNKENLLTKYTKKEIWELPKILSKFDKQIYERKRLGEELFDNKGKKNESLRKLYYTRNIIRRILLEKLKEWENPKTRKPELTYDDILKIEEKRRINNSELMEEE